MYILIMTLTLGFSPLSYTIKYSQNPFLINEHDGFININCYTSNLLFTNPSFHTCSMNYISSLQCSQCCYTIYVFWVNFLCLQLN